MNNDIADNFIIKRPTGTAGLGAGFNIQMYDSLGNWTSYGAMYASLVDPTDGSETGKLRFFTRIGGSWAARLEIDENGNLRPTTDNSYDLGSSSLQFRYGYFKTTIFTGIVGLARDDQNSELRITGGDNFSFTSDGIHGSGIRMYGRDSGLGDVKIYAFNGLASDGVTGVAGIIGFYSVNENGTVSTLGYINKNGRLFSWGYGDFGQNEDGTSYPVRARRNTNSVGSFVGIAFFAKDSLGNWLEYGFVGSKITSPTSGSESGTITFYTRSGGSWAARLEIDENGNLRPTTDNSYDLGSSNYRWINGFFGSRVYVGTPTTGAYRGVMINGSEGAIELWRGDDGVPYIDFKTDYDTDYDARIQKTNTHALDFKVGGSGSIVTAMRMTASGTIDAYYSFYVGKLSDVSGQFRIYRPNATVNSLVGTEIYLHDSLSNWTPYAGIYGRVVDSTDGSETGALDFFTMIGGSFAKRCFIDGSGHFLPAADNTYDLGSSSYKWRYGYINVMYSNYLRLNLDPYNLNTDNWISNGNIVNLIYELFTDNIAYSSAYSAEYWDFATSTWTSWTEDFKEATDMKIGTWVYIDYDHRKFRVVFSKQKLAQISSLICTINPFTSTGGTNITGSITVEFDNDPAFTAPVTALSWSGTINYGHKFIHRLTNNGYNYTYVRITFDLSIPSGGWCYLREIRLPYARYDYGWLDQVLPFDWDSTPNILPLSDNNQDLGSSSYRWASIYAMKVKHYTDCVLPTSAPASPEAGSMYFDTTTGTLYIYDGTAWKSVTLT